MSRPAQPEKKAELLERCLEAAIQSGSLGSSISAIAKRVGTSSRMLVYHFGSKQALELELVGLLEARLRAEIWPSHTGATTQTGSLEDKLLALWHHLIAPDTVGLLRLSMEINQRALHGDAATQAFLEQESQEWLGFLVKLTSNEHLALGVFHLFHGAILDFLTTGNQQRGLLSIQAFSRALAKLPCQDQGQPRQEAQE